MTFEIAVVFIVLAVVIFLFAFEVFSVDKTAFLILGTLLLFDIISPEEAISGLSNPATITILSLMIIAYGLDKNGVIGLIADRIKNLMNLPLWLMIPVFMFLSGSISAFISTTAVVIVFIKIITALSVKFKLSRTKLLMPISFAGIIGGSCTLMGTSTNLIVNDVAARAGVATFTFFEFSWYGAIFLALAILVIAVMQRFLPVDVQADPNAKEEVKGFMTILKIDNESDYANIELTETPFFKEKDIDVIRVTRGETIVNYPENDFLLQAEDQILLKSNFKKLFEYKDLEHLEKKIEQTDAKKGFKIVELLQLPSSKLIGKYFKDIDRFQLKGAIPVALQKGKSLPKFFDKVKSNSLNKLSVDVGDVLMVESSESSINKLNDIDNMMLLQECELPDKPNKFKRAASALILILVVVLAATGTFSILKSTIAGVFLMLVFRCVELNKVYSQIDWQIIFLLAGMIPLGIAMSNSGADVYLSENLISLFQGMSPAIIISILFFITMVLSGFVSNNATAVILAPIAIAVAAGLSVDPKPFLLAVMFAANFSFFTPIGYQTNTLIYGMGIYKFKDFLIVGGILSVVVWIVASLLLSMGIS